MFFLQLEKKKSDRQLNILLISPSESPQEEYVILLRQAFDALGYRVILLRDFSEIPSFMKQVDGVWCLQTKVEGNDNLGCFQKMHLNLHGSQKVWHFT